jgi:hypothetical protein
MSETRMSDQYEDRRKANSTSQTTQRIKVEFNRDVKNLRTLSFDKKIMFSVRCDYSNEPRLVIDNQHVSMHRLPKNRKKHRKSQRKRAST